MPNKKSIFDYTGCCKISVPPFTAKLGDSSTLTLIFSESIFKYNFVCKKSGILLCWFTSGDLICKGWSNLLSRIFLAVFPDGHCAKSAVKYLIHGLEKQMTPYFKAYSFKAHIKKTKLEKKVFLTSQANFIEEK